jgi:hypothetical protein
MNAFPFGRTILFALVFFSPVGSPPASAQGVSTSPTGPRTPWFPAPYAPVPATRPRPEFWLPDSPIETMAIAGGRLYIGGGFARIGPFTGPFAVLHATSGLPIPTWPRCDGHVNTVIADGQGGWYVGGYFSRIGVSTRSNVAHVLSNGTVDSFAPMVGSEVYTLTLDQSTLFVGGSFMIAGGQPRYRAAAFDTVSGNLLPWAPISQQMNNSDRILRILVDGQTVYLAGYYDTLNAFPRRHLAAVDAVTGSLITAFNPNPDGSVVDLALSDSTLYVGGNFALIGGIPRGRVAALDRQTWVVGPFNPGFNNTVDALALSGTTLYVGGFFSMANGQARSCGAAFATGSGNLLAWDPQAAVPEGGNLEILDLAVGLGAVYVAGGFQSVGGARQFGVGRLDPATGNALSWVGDAAGPDATEVHSIALQGGSLACAGNFSIMGGEFRESAAALSLGTGELTPWHPVVIGSVGRILLSGSTVWLGGQFSYVNGIARKALASVDASTGATNTTFDAGFFLPSDFVTSLALCGSTLFAGGGFHTPIPGQDNLIALDPATGAIVPGSTDTGGTVRELVASPDGSRLFVAGQFTDLGNPPVARNYLAAIDPTNGNVLPWDPNPNQTISALQYYNGRVWAAGNFTQIGFQVHGGLASIDPITGAVSPTFSPILQNSGVNVGASALAMYEWTLIAGGDFNTVNSQTQYFMAALDSGNGFLLNWDPVVPNGVSRLLSAGGVLAANGARFTYPTGEARPYLAVYAAP